MLYSFLCLYILPLQVLAEEIVPLESYTSQNELDITSKFVTIGIFLAIMSVLAYYFIGALKSGKLKLPAAMMNKSFLIKGLNDDEKINKYNMKLLDRQLMPDGSELWVVDIEGRHLLLAKSLSGALNYLTELNTKASANNPFIGEFGNSEN